MSEITMRIAILLQVTPMDVYILAGGLVAVAVFLLMGLQKTYETMFGLVVGLAIYLMLTVLLSPQYQTPDTVKFFSPSVSNFLVGSSAYLIFILMILTPLSGGIKIPLPRNQVVRILSHLAISALLFVFVIALVLGFASKTYIFGIDTGFVLLGKSQSYHDLIATKIVGWIAKEIQPIVLFCVFFMLYKLLFADIAGALAAAFVGWMKSLKDKNGSAPAMADDHGHDDHGHDAHDDLADFDLDDHGHGHDDHGHGGHH